MDDGNKKEIFWTAIVMSVIFLAVGIAFWKAEPSIGITFTIITPISLFIGVFGLVRMKKQAERAALYRKRRAEELSAKAEAEKKEAQQTINFNEIAIVKYLKEKYEVDLMALIENAKKTNFVLSSERLDGNFFRITGNKMYKLFSFKKDDTLYFFLPLNVNAEKDKFARIFSYDHVSVSLADDLKSLSIEEVESNIFKVTSDIISINEQSADWVEDNRIALPSQSKFKTSITEGLYGTAAAINSSQQRYTGRIDNYHLDYFVIKFGKNVKIANTTNELFISKSNADCCEDFKDLYMQKQEENFHRKSNTSEKTTTNIDVVSELKKYKELLDSGILTQEEFDCKKKELLKL